MALACSQQTRLQMSGLEQHGSALGSRQHTGSAGGRLNQRAADAPGCRAAAGRALSFQYHI